MQKSRLIQGIGQGCAVRITRNLDIHGSEISSGIQKSESCQGIRVMV